MGTYTIYAQNGGVITFTTGNDDFFNVGNGELEADLISQDGGLKELTVTTAINNINDISTDSSTLIGVMQEQNFNKSVLELDKNNLIKAQNIYLQNQQKIAYASAKNHIRNTKALLDSQDANTSMLNQVYQSLQAIKESNEASQILQSEQYIVSSEIRDHLKELVKATKEQQLQLNADSISMGNLNIDTQSIVNALNSRNENQIATNQKIVEGVESQKTTNTKIVENLTKQNSYYDFYNNGGLALVSENLTTHTETLNKESEKLDFEKDGLTTLTNSEGKVIKPREAKAIKDSEFAISETAENKMDYGNVLGKMFDGLGIQKPTQTGETEKDDESNLIKYLFDQFQQYDNNKIDFPENIKDINNG